jgi:hypothetical protein
LASKKRYSKPLSKLFEQKVREFAGCDVIFADFCESILFLAQIRTNDLGCPA